MDPLIEQQTPMVPAVSAQPADSRSVLAAEFLEPQLSAGQAARMYTSHNRKQREDELIVKYLPLVHKIVNKIVTYLQPPLSKDDLVSAGTVGLVKAARDFDPSKDAEFKTYAYIRIRGAVIDELRNWSFAPANIKKQFDQAQEISSQMLEEQGTVPDDSDLAGRLGMTTEKMYRMFETARARHFLSIHGADEESPMLGNLLTCGGAGVSDAIEMEELIEKMTRAIGELPEKQRRIVVMYYQKELTMKQIAEVLEITESRVSQLHAAALFKLSVQLKDE
ncbi:MAG: FliA/WhiG family RNA polymerase sigma factor [Sedimentisphaerales bacterium]|nr:FliA/WhiG family RNA polymerase sigma factor [Sedimentisphaerales bacterium]